jgi:uncharacterized protein (TIGR03083 family)
MTYNRDQLVAELTRVWTSLAELGGELSDDEWGRPTACPGWTVRDQLSHIVGTEAMLLGRPTPEVDIGDAAHVRNDIGRFNEPWVAERRDRHPAELLEELVAVTGMRAEQLEGMTQDDFDRENWTPAGRDTYGRFMQIRVFDQWMHEQDIREAVGRPGSLDGPVAERALAEASNALGFLIGKRAGAPDGSSVRIELTGPIQRTFDVVVEGRARLVEEPVAEPTATVTTDSTTFMRLAGGRIDPSEPLADGRVKLSGDTDLAERVARNLDFVL